MRLLIELGDIADAEELKAVRRQVDDNWRTFALQTHGVEPARAICPRPQRAEPQVMA